MLEEIKFDWDQWNIQKNEIKHGVSKFEAVFLPTTLLRNMRWPFVDLSIIEMIQGAGAKAWPFFATVQWYNYQYSDVEWAWWTAFTLSLCLDLFHGVEASSWMDFQDALYKLRGARYQTNFNRAYGYFWGTNFRLIAYSAGKIEGLTGLTDGMFSGAWLGTVYLTNQIGAQFGTRGFQALNRLYEMGKINKQTRDFLQQWVRDFFFVLCGAIIGAGGELDPKFWTFFAAQQVFDETLWVVSEMTEQKPVLLVGTKEAFESPDFQYRFPNAFLSTPIPGARPKWEVAKDVGRHVKAVPVAVFSPLFNLFLRPALAIKKGCGYLWKRYFWSE